MRKIGSHALWVLVAIALLPGAMAQDERFGVRFGLIVLDPTSDSDLTGGRNELSTAYGGQGTFEWYFAPSFGIEGSMAIALDADVESDGDVFAGVSVIPITFGINWHPVRTTKFDWGIGALGGLVSYTDFEFDDRGSGSTTSTRTEEDGTYGFQTFLDYSFAGRWGMSFGVKWLDSELEVNGERLSVDPLIVGVMGKFHF